MANKNENDRGNRSRPLSLIPSPAREEGGEASALARDSHNIDRVALQWLLAAAVLACAVLATELPWWANTIFAVSVVWRYTIERFHVYRPGRLPRYLLLALIVVAVYREFGTILGRDPGLALVISLLGLKLLELRGQRDAMFTLFLLYVVLMGGFLFSQNLLGALWTVATVVVTLIALARLQQPLPWRANARMAVELVLKAVPLLLILYVLFPRVGGTFWGMRTDGGGITGMPEEVAPGSIHNLSESSEIAFRVDFTGDAPPERERYWRALVLWQTDGQTWRRDAPAMQAETIRPLGPPVEYRITLEATNKRWLLALDVPASVPRAARVRPGLTIINNEPVRERMTYALTSYTRYRTGALADAERDAALALPPVSARVRAYAEALRTQQHEPAAIANAVLTQFRQENFVYTLAPPPLGDDPVDQFLFETRRGFCEHYASAFTTLMRAAGVPARMVIGYQGGEMNPTGNYLIVRQFDAHAWSEVWLPERGWVRVDPTAAVAPERIELGLEAIRRLEARGLVPGAVGADLLARAMELPWFERTLRQLRLYWDYTNLAWYRFVVDYGRENQENFLRALGFEKIEWPRVLAMLGGACVMVLLAYVAWARRAPVRDPAQRVYLRFCRKLARAGIRRAAHEGPLAFAERATRRRPDLRRPIDAITSRYLDLRYGEHASNDMLRELAHDVRAFRAR